MFEPRPGIEVLGRLRPVLGTLVSIEVEARSRTDGVAAVEAGYAAMQRVDELMHPTRPASDLARIAAASVGSFLAIDKWTLEVLHQSRRLNLESQGAFDPCLPLSPGRISHVELCADGVICHAPVTMDLGGIAKGFAVDVAVNELRRLGCHSGLVNAGGDLRVFGSAPREVLIRGADGDLLPIELRDAALAASGPRTDAAPSEHRGYYHGLSGSMVIGRAVAVTAESAMIADALCKCALLCAPTLLAKLLEFYRARLLY